MNGVKTKMKVMARLIWPMTLLAILSVIFPTATSSLALSPFTCQGQAQPSNAYDGTSVSSYRYDSTATPFAEGRRGWNSRTAGTSEVFADLHKSIAAEETASLLPARSPWPGNSGFIEGTVERKFLMPGETFDRYGFGGGRFVSPAGTPLDARALRAGTENLPFNTYQVVKPFEVNAGSVQPWFGQPGLGTQ